MAKKSPSKKKQPELTVSKLLKNLRKKKKKQKSEPAGKNRNLPSVELQKNTLMQAELSEENFITEEEALGPAVQNEAYLVLARRYRLCRWAIIASLLLFLLFMFNLFREEITIENFRYLMRNVNFELKTEIDEASIIMYDSDEQNVFALYKNSLAVANGQRITLYDAGGRSSITAEHNYSAPALKASEKYLLAYDRAGGSYSLYNTFSQMHTDSTGYPICDADLTDDGVYAIASRSKEYFGVVTIYNSAFKTVNKIQKNKYIASVDLSEDGKSVLIASYQSGDSGFVTELMTLQINSDEPTLLFTVEDTLPYRAQWTEDGEFLLCSDSGIKFFDKNGKVYNEYIFLGQNVIKYSVDASGAAIVTTAAANSDRSTLVLLDRKGKESGRYNIEEAISSLTLSNGIASLVSESNAWKVEDGKLYRFEADRRLQAVVLGDDLAWLCGYTRVLLPEWEKVD